MEMLNQDDYVDLERFYLKEKLGSGAFSDVYLIEDKATSEIFAAKILKDEITTDSREELIRFSREVNYNAGMNHPSVLKFIGYSPFNFNNEPFPVIIMEYCRNGSLESLIKDRDKYAEIWDDTKKLIMIFGIASGMKYLHLESQLISYWMTEYFQRLLILDFQKKYKMNGIQFMKANLDSKGLCYMHLQNS